MVKKKKLYILLIQNQTKTDYFVVFILSPYNSFHCIAAVLIEIIWVLTSLFPQNQVYSGSSKTLSCWGLDIGIAFSVLIAFFGIYIKKKGNK